MTPEERDLITGLFQRLKAADVAGKDREAEDLINRLVVQQPTAPYLLTQTVLVQEHALNGAQARIAQLEGELAAAKQNGEPREAGGNASFLGGLMGGGLMGRGPWGARSEPAATQPAATPATASRPAAGPLSATSVPVTASSGGGFLQQALTTAAGVAGGALLFDGIRSLFFHNPGPFGPALGAGWGPSLGGQPMGGLNETTIVNNYYGNDPTGGGAVDAGDTSDKDASGAQDADAGSDLDTASDSDLGGSDFGGGDDSSFT